MAYGSGADMVSPDTAGRYITGRCIATRSSDLWAGAGAPGPHRAPRSSAETGLRLY